MVWTTNDGIHFFRRPSPTFSIHPFLFFSPSLCSTARSTTKYSSAHNILRILLCISLVLPLGKYLELWDDQVKAKTLDDFGLEMYFWLLFSGNTQSSVPFLPPSLKVTPREWKLPTDEKVRFSILIGPQFYVTNVVHLSI